jgi:polyisoprenoid-binding protein YceI
MAICTALLLCSSASYAQLFSSSTGNISFFSKTPVEDIEAHSKVMLGVMNIEKRTLAFKVANTSFEFKNKLMQEHFNEKYMESEKYPESSFAGKINETVDLTKNGDYPVTVTGKLKVHGVEKDRTIAGVISVKDGRISIKSDFKVLVKDHNITIPTLVLAKIAEEITVMADILLEQKK